MTAKSRSTGPSKRRGETVDLVLNLLNALANSQGVSAGELAAAVAADIVLVDEVLNRFAESGFVFKDPLELYWLGPQVVYIGSQASARNALIYASSGIMDDLVRDTQQDAVTMNTREGMEVRLVVSRGPAELLRIPPMAASKGPLHIGGTSKVMLAFAPQEVIDEVIEKHLHEFTPSTCRTREAVLELLQAIRTDGFYLSVGESHARMSTICAPVKNARGQVVAVLSLIGRTGELDRVNTSALIQQTLDGAKQISRRLGGISLPMQLSAIKSR